jgi:FixJ family two-component response regulator
MILSIQLAAQSASHAIENFETVARQGTAIVSKLPIIAVIDDDASVRIGTENLLASLGYSVSTFASAEEFLRSGLSNDISCVIADIRMPGMSGMELLTLLTTQGRRIPFIFITAFAEEAARAEALNEGAICLLSKPFDKATLVRCLDIALAE